MLMFRGAFAAVVVLCLVSSCCVACVLLSAVPCFVSVIAFAMCGLP